MKDGQAAMSCFVMITLLKRFHQTLSMRSLPATIENVITIPKESRSNKTSKLMPSDAFLTLFSLKRFAQLTLLSCTPTSSWLIDFLSIEIFVCLNCWTFSSVVLSSQRRNVL